MHVSDMVASGETPPRYCGYFRHCQVHILVAAVTADLMFVVTLHARSVSDARFILSLEGATAVASTLDVRLMFVCVLAEGTKQNLRPNQFRESFFILQQ